LARKGLPKWAIAEARRRGAKNVFAYAWTLVKRKGKRSRKSNPGHNPGRKRKRRSIGVARRKRRRRSRSLTIPLAPVAGLAAGLWEPAQFAMQGRWDWALFKLARNYTGFNPANNTWNANELKNGLIPLIVGLLVHKFVGGRPLNLNQMLARAGVPFVRI
jgi:hypothetical protein